MISNKFSKSFITNQIKRRIKKNNIYNDFITNFKLQKLNPKIPDPIQAKIFMFFPIFLTVILAPFPSGLLLYWCANNVLQMLQQYIVMRQTKIKTV